MGLTDDRKKQLMEGFGMPNSRSLLVLIEQVANEVEQEVRAETPPPSGTGEDVANLKKQLAQIEEREAACCPEDVPFDEYIRVLEKKLDCFSQGNPGQKEETKPMLTELEDAADIIRKMYSTEPCEFDHHGFCQSHGWMSAAPCPHQRAKDYLKKYPEKPEWQQNNSLDMHCDGGDDGY